MSNLEQLSVSVPTKKLPFSQLIRRIGPGIVLTGVVIGPGAITTASMLGAEYGYALLWLLIPIAFMGISFMLTTYRIAMLTGMPSIEAIRHYYGSVAAGFVGVATFLACLFFTMGNISGTGAGMNLIFGLDWKIGSAIMIVVMIYCYFSKGVYSKVEKGITICIVAMIFAFYATLIGTGGPDISASVDGITHWVFPAGSFVAALGFISTNASLTTGIYGTYLGKEKKWKKDDLFNGVMVADSVAHIIGVLLISGAIIFVGAIVLFPQNISITTPTQLADLLVPSMGNAAKYIMGIALLGAGFSSLLGNTQRGVVLLNSGFNKSTALESKAVQWGSMIVLVIAGGICYSFGGSPVQLIYLANVATAVSTPVAGLFICLMLWRKDINAGYKTPRVLQVCMTLSYIFCLFLTLIALVNTLPKFTSSISSVF
ncbi:TPA: Nramp family divalent metal transporter [Kluyvera georgiana]|uniref:Nramp family divalent metal transporter n=1 Tax=Kluyvera georgiana TaxID=73098 RepID=UPI0008070B82|nr:Nramp family divalent metal transporter [Kluyvera georgiana]HED1421308.1 Nramp family divalent metal transporter [Kluyvera georgiana]